MIRNIPTNFSKEHLINEFTESHQITHETPELPFDKKNKMNPGYAFVQFWHPLYFADFYHKHNKKLWQNTKSTKVIEFSYGRHEKKGKNLELIEE
jgi:RNA recognition motif-containing protein